MGAEPATLNAILASDASASEVNQYLFDTLIERDRDTLEFIPKIAYKWEISEDKKTYTFYMRKDVRWHDGMPVTADDVIYSFKLIKDPKIDAPFIKVYYQDIESIKKLDRFTVQFKASKIYFMALSMCGGLTILPKHILEKEPDFEHSSFSRAPIGNGPYKFKAWETNKRITLERFETYWDKKPAIKTIDFKIIGDESVALQSLKKGEIDVMGLRPIQWVRQTSSPKFNSQFSKFKYPSPGYSYVGWNNKSPFFSDKRVRLAMTQLIDRKKINEKINFGLNLIVTGPFFPDSNQYNQDVLPLPYDQGKARALLTEAGWQDSDGDGWLDKNGKKFEFTFLYPSESKFSERFSTILREELNKTGIKMNIVRMEWAAFLNRIEKKDFDATALGWSTSFEGDPYQIWHSSQAKMVRGSNSISFINAQADLFIEEARIEFDEDKRNGFYWRLHALIDSEQPYTFMYASPALVVVSKRFANVRVHKAGLNMLEWEIKKPVSFP
jgi:peptide/nickel transport system substrate-binding protein